MAKGFKRGVYKSQKGRSCTRQRAVLFDFGLRKFDPRLGSRIVPWVFLGYFGGIKTDFKIFEVKKLFFETL